MLRRLVRPTAALGAVLVLLGLMAIVPSASAVPATFEVRGSIGQVYVWGTTPGATVELLDGADAVVATATADAQGAALFKDGSYKVIDDSLRLTVGDPYTVRVGAEVSTPVTILGIPALGTGTNPDQAFYDAQTIIPGNGAIPDASPNPVPAVPGYKYLTTRDGTTLSINVMLPPGADPVNHPERTYPTVIEYSGYSPSAPNQTSQSLLPYWANGYAVVAVNMRGTGCSGGAYWYSEPAQATDGYDVVETIAAQPWSGKVGMVGISFSGISQLYVAATNPPNLSAVVPMAVIADTFRSALYPGGILNDGFALNWATDRVEDTVPGALGWVTNQINGGDTICEGNMALRLQHEPILDEITPTRFWEVRAAGLAPRTFVDQIEAPTLLIGAWQDEQTGGDFATMLDNFSPTTKKRFILTNGVHAEGMFPEILPLAMEWTDIYVGERTPVMAPIIRAGAPAIYQPVLDIADDDLDQVAFPADRFAGMSYPAAKAAYEAEPPVWLFWENGTGNASLPGYPKPIKVTKHSSWPLTSQEAWSLFLSPDGSMGAREPSLGDDEPRGITSWTHDETDGATTNLTGTSQEDPWAIQPDYHWLPIDEDTSASWTTSPMTAATSFAGSGSVDLWLRSSAVDTDLEVTLSEVRPDGQEIYIQSGWLRASQRAVDPLEATALWPFKSHLEADEEPLPAGEFSLNRVELVPFAHSVRAGSRLRLTVDAPGGNKSFWEFMVEQHAPPVTNEVAMTRTRPSALVLPRINDVGLPAALPPCPYSVRSQPCRDWVPSRAPTGVYGDPNGAGGIEIHWTPPATSDLVTGYTVKMFPSGAQVAFPGNVTSTLMTPPNPSADVWFTVTAGYADGTQTSSPSHVLTADGVGPFDDVPVGHPFFDDVMFLRTEGITDGYTDNTYRPVLGITRQALVSFLHRLDGSPAGPFPDPGFSDVDASNPFYEEISWAAENGIVNGYSDGTFRPGAPITRQALAALLHRLAGAPAGPFTDPGFSDVPSTHTFATAIWWAAEHGVVSGYSDGTYRPTVGTSRMAMASFLHRYALLPA